MSNNIQNELIKLVAEKIQDTNMKALHHAKYFSIILDCTPDISHKEQMTVILRYVQCIPNKGIQIREAILNI